MALETGNYISDLVVSNPTGMDNKSTGDDHMRLIKKTIKATFPNLDGPVIATPAQINTLSSAGDIIMWPVATPKFGYLLCSGAAVSRTTYAALFAIVGVTFGAGDGATTFNLPNYQDRMPIGAGAAYAAAATGGAATSTLATVNLPSHNHTVTITDAGHSHGVNDPGHSHTYEYLYDAAVRAGSNGLTPFTRSGVQTLTSTTGISIASATSGVTAVTQNTGSATPIATISPYIGIYFIIKT